ncbi:hypothetical protein [Kitasatospora sp. NPDC050543]|uniref:hypothetical protein n=1 Tax=Kitasatospora sp. NPDC050543 TaxID=3364054 RepID=UPI0037A21C52
MPTRSPDAAARRRVAGALATASAALWAVAPFYLLLVRTPPGSRLPPREQWGAAEEETAQLNDLETGITAVLLIAVAALAAWLWSFAARTVRRVDQDATLIVGGTTVLTGLLATVATGKTLNSLTGAAALGVLTPLVAVGLGAALFAISAPAPPGSPASSPVRPEATALPGGD